MTDREHQPTATAPDHPASATKPAGDAHPRAAQGRLARLLATRGGTAAPEAPFVIEHREALIYMLCEAAELEHGIMCQYLFAAFSLKESEDEGLTADELAAVTRWQRQILNVAAGEMLHLALVHNLLTAIGAAPHLSRPNLPAPAGHYPAGVQLLLLPFGEQALRHFMFLERPEGMDLHDAEGLAAMQTATPSVNPRDIVPTPQDFATVGHLYRSIEAGFRHLTEKYGEDWLFTGPLRAQATPASFGWPNLLPVTGLDSACAAVEEIVEQGEGPRGHWRNAHFGQFVAILDEYQRMGRANPGFEPARPVMAANVRPHDRADAVPLITDPLTARVTDLFNVGYEILLQLFERFFAHTTETDTQLKVLADASVALMVQVIKPLGSLITTLPAGPDYPARTAGPSFELFYESDYLMPHQHAAWALLAERLDAAAWLCSELCAGRGTAVAGQLEPVLDAIRQIAASLATHLSGGSPQAALAAVGPRLLAADIDALATACTRILDGIPAGASPGEAADAACASRAAGELLSAVRDLPGPGGRPAAGDPEIAAPAGRLREAVLAATRLRAGLGRACPPELTEAVAALQDLLLRVAPHQQEPAWRDDLWQAQSGLRASIQAARNGPYLATNVPTVVNHLGIATTAPPQLALCRCGDSAVKPACDGTCRANGFSDAKDPARVPDQRDTYRGQQVTVFDNRGICQHSGYCTDRLPAVFRADNDPFVAPSGGRMDEIIRAARDCPSGALSYALGGTEARADVDGEGHRPPAIEITADGPYRVTGRIPLAGPDGEPAAHAQGASAEHYALCRCGHSRNKPFCSGMHWYVGFTDPPARPSPTLFEHAGGAGPLTRTARLLYEKHIPADPLLAPVFADMPADQPQALAAWLAAALGGPPLPGPDQAGHHQAGPNQAGHNRAGRARTSPPAESAAGLPRSLLSPAGQPLTEDQRARWASLASRAADEAGLPADPGFRSAFASCLEWVSRVAAQSPAAGVPAAVPIWDWGPGGPPGPARQDAGGDAAQPVTLPAPGEPVSFDTHIKALFRDRDRQSMSFAFDLWSADDVRAHAHGILQRLQDGSMPCDGAWPAGQVAVFERWTETGMEP
jgi:CDGSH-type Zn-finger protein/truncated hemoglobin YjbI